MKASDVILVLCVIGCMTTSGWAAEARTTGDGSRAVPVHRIPLKLADPLDETVIMTVSPTDEETLLPFSTRRTCSECHVCRHDYDRIAGGWHFNALDPNVPAGRPGEPWILADAALAVQLPLSYRGWPGTYRPQQLGFSTFQFTQRFGAYMPGGGVGEAESADQDDILRQMVSGPQEINCLLCHDAHAGQDCAEVAHQMEQENFRWAAAAGCAFTTMEGAAADMPETFDPFMPELDDPGDKVPPFLAYEEGIFNEQDEVFFDIVREVPTTRCYFCHSQIVRDHVDHEKWQADEDVHLQAGMTCVDCHREGLGHQTIRGYPGETNANPLAAQSSCRGCHFGTDSAVPQAGRLGAPVPAHRGIPTIHFERLTCTACHAGPWPGKNSSRLHTARAHGLGSHGPAPTESSLPYISGPVLAQQADGRLAPHRILWPAFWASADANEVVTPVHWKTVEDVVGPVLQGLSRDHPGAWPVLEPNQVAAALTALADVIEDPPLYIAGGILYTVNATGDLEATEGPAVAAPYLWPIGHDVRPAAQSLGVRSCQDCHDAGAPFLSARVAIDTPVADRQDATMPVLTLQGVDPALAQAFATTFVFRPWLKIVGLTACAVIALLLLVYALRALGSVTRSM